MDQHNPILPINLRRFVSVFIGDAHYRTLPDVPLAQLIKVLDPQEVCAHVEFPSLENMQEHPVLWKHEHWVTEYTRIQRVRAQSDKNREAYLIRREYLMQLIRALMKTLLLTQEEVQPIALKIILEKNVGAARQFGVDISSMPPAPSKTPEVI